MSDPIIAAGAGLLLGWNRGGSASAEWGPRIENRKRHLCRWADMAVMWMDWRQPSTPQSICIASKW
jgi:hypothetical protein